MHLKQSSSSTVAMSVCVYIVKGTVSQDVHLRILLAKLNNLGPLLTCRSIFEYCFKFVEMFDCDSPESVGFLKTQKCPGINLKTLNLCCIHITYKCLAHGSLVQLSQHHKNVQNVIKLFFFYWTICKKQHLNKGVRLVRMSL